MLRLVAFNPIQGTIKEAFKKVIMAYHFDETDDRYRRQIVEQLGAGRL